MEVITGIGHEISIELKLDTTEAEKQLVRLHEKIEALKQSAKEVGLELKATN